MSEIDIRPVGFFQLWPRQKKKWFCLLLLVWLLALYGAARLDCHNLDPFQRYYLPAYLRTSLSPDSNNPLQFSVLMASYKGVSGAALATSLADHTDPLTPDQLPTALLADVSFRWDSITTSNAALRPFLRSLFYQDRPFVSWTPWSKPCVFFWSCLIAFAFPLTILGAFFIDFMVTRRLRSGIVNAGTRLLTRTTFLRRIVRWKKFLWTPWKLGLTFRVKEPYCASDFLMAPFWLLACLLRTIASTCLTEFPGKRTPWVAAAITTLSWLMLAFCIYRLDIHLDDGILATPTFFTLLPLLCLTVFATFATFATSALFLPAAWSRLSDALHPQILGIPADKENQHFLLMGDTGTGKSSLLRQIIRSIRDRRETLVIYDPDGTYASEFYDPERDDVILNPLDARCPYWQPNAEVHDAGEAETLAAGYYPQIAKSSGSTEFFYTAARKILAYLFTHRATAAEIADWLSDPEKLTNLLKHTELKQYVAEYAGQMRGGVEATLSAVVSGLRLLPPESQDPDPKNPNAELRPRRTWSILDWAQTRQGWVFITNDKAHRLSLMPLISAWLDNILLRLMATKPQGDFPNVWVVMDELASLHRLPQLEVGLTEIRKHHVSMVLGFQGIAQLQENYTEHPAEVILSQPATKIFLRTSENKGAKWISDYLGQQDIEITSETKSEKTGTGYSKKTEKVSLVSPTTIAHLDDLTGYMSHGNFVTSLALPYTKAVERHPAHIARFTKPFTLREPPLSVRPAPPDPNPAPAVETQIAPSDALAAVPSTTVPGPTSNPIVSAPDTCPGFWFGELARDWGLRHPVLSKHLERLANRFHPLSSTPLATNGIGLTQECLDFSFPIIGAAPADPKAPASDKALMAHYATVINAVNKLFPEEQYGKWLGLLLDADPTRAPDNSLMVLNSTVYVCHGPTIASAPKPNSDRRPSERPGPPPSISEPGAEAATPPGSTRKRRRDSAPAQPQPQPQLPHTSPSGSIALEEDQLTLPGLDPFSEPDSPTPQTSQPKRPPTTCTKCLKRIPKGAPRIFTATGQPLHPTCADAPTKA